MINRGTILKHSPDLNNSFELSDGLAVQISDELHTMNESAREIFEMFDGLHSVREIVNGLTDRYPGNEDVNTIVDGFVMRMYKAGLLVE